MTVISPALHVDEWTETAVTLALACEPDGRVVALSLSGLEGLASLVDTPPDRWVGGGSGTLVARTQLGEYFLGRRRQFDLVLSPRVGTSFQKRVWAALERIPYGHTWSYARLAAEVGSVARAVGGANGANPIPIIRPCHRVIGADGSLTGFAGGLKLKEWLLRHEGALSGQQAELL